MPQSAGEVVAALESGGIVLSRSFEQRGGEDGILLRAAAPRSLLGRWRRYRVDAGGSEVS